MAPRLAGRLTGAAPDEAEAEAVEILATAEGRLRAQDLDGLAGEVLLPDPALLDALLAADDAERQRAGIEAYNAWAATLQAKAPHRIVAVAQIPTTGLDAALEALGAAQAAGVRAVSLSRPPAGAGTTPADGDEFWRQAGDRTVVVLGPAWDGVTFAGRAAPKVAAGRPSSHVAMLTRLALTGIWDDVPELRMLIAGVDAGWIPYVLEAADTNYMRTAASRPVDLRREDALPSDYVRRHVFATFGEDRIAALSTRYFGPHHLLWSAALPTRSSRGPTTRSRPPASPWACRPRPAACCSATTAAGCSASTASRTSPTCSSPTSTAPSSSDAADCVPRPRRPLLAAGSLALARSHRSEGAPVSDPDGADGWQVVARSDEVAPGPIARALDGRPIVVWRTSSGRLSALADSCPHQGDALLTASSLAPS